MISNDVYKRDVFFLKTNVCITRPYSYVNDVDHGHDFKSKDFTNNTLAASDRNRFYASGHMNVHFD